MRVTLHVSDWRGYEHAQLSAGPGSLTVVAGPNNSGKSSLLEAFDVVAGLAVAPGMRRSGAREPALVAAEFSLTDHEYEGLLTQLKDPSGHRRLESFRRFQMEWRDLSDQRMYMSAVRTWISGRPVDMFETTSVDAAGNSEYRILNWDWLLAVTADDVATWPEDPVWQQGRSTIDEFDLASRLRVFAVPLQEWRSGYFRLATLRSGTSDRRPLGSADRLSPLGENLPERLLRLSSAHATWDKIASFIHELVPDAGRLNVPPTDSEHVWVVLTEPETGREFNLKDLGSGVETLIQIAVAGIGESPGGCLVVEEPESALHPGAQRLLLRHLEVWARDRTVVVSTHSPILLGGAGRHFVVGRDRGRSQLTPIDDEGRTGLDALGVRMGDVLSADRLLLVEGRSDADVLKTWFGERLARARAVVQVTHGSDAMWRVRMVQLAFEEADALGRRILLLRDRDELPDSDLAELADNPAMAVLTRRELENYLLDPAAIAAALSELGAAEVPDPATIESIMDMAADRLRPVVHLKRVVARFEPIRLFDHDWVKGAVDAPSEERLIARINELFGAADDLVNAVRLGWEEEAGWLSARWPASKLEICAGAELLAAVWSHCGFRYKKTRDGQVIAQHMSAPSELATILDSFLEDNDA